MFSELQAAIDKKGGTEAIRKRRVSFTKEEIKALSDAISIPDAPGRHYPLGEILKKEPPRSDSEAISETNTLEKAIEKLKTHLDNDKVSSNEYSNEYSNGVKKLKAYCNRIDAIKKSWGDDEF